ncbi:clusterin-associated protein 1 isoform X1 [Orussus abietinus]|uniref:clusterin-associated protein 1 isoform X1 n=1 Tax=Orussus abietinus TaxID=222816 RepID=UPI000625F8C4|nr:clusterin-associated protein 1 isoform X1 [Orussus abietinus]
MSFRDLRNLTEMMRVLGYPRLISLSNFRLPNFPLVAEMLVWLVKRFDPEADVPVEHETEQERVALIRCVAEFTAVKTSVKLNTKKLYQADGYAVKELLKLTSLLYEARSQSPRENAKKEETTTTSSSFDVSDRVDTLKTTRQLGSQLTVSGAALFDSLGREVDLREIRNSKVSRQLDTSEIEAALEETIESTRTEIAETRGQIDNVKETEQSLDAKIERRRTELDRNQKRLQTLRKVRPAFMEELEKLELELRLLYEDYLQKFRYLAYLEHLHEDAAKAEQERFERRQAATRKQLELMRSKDVTFESTIEGNDSIFGANLQEPLGLGELDGQPVDKSGPDVRGKTGKRKVFPSRRNRPYGVSGPCRNRKIGPELRVPEANLRKHVGEAEGPREGIRRQRGIAGQRQRSLDRRRPRRRRRRGRRGQRRGPPSLGRRGRNGRTGPEGRTREASRQQDGSLGRGFLNDRRWQ